MQPTRRKKQLVTKTITVPGNLQRACDEFNQGKFFECHESIEEIWQLESGPLRDFYKGLIQIAAAFVHLSRAKYIGGERLLRTGTAYLAPYRAGGAMGFDVAAICSSAEAVYSRLVAAGAGNVASLDLADRPQYEFKRSEMPAEARRWRAWGFDERGNAEPTEITVAE
jgi:hypothetical protein